MTACERNDMLFDAILKAAVAEAFEKEIAGLPVHEALTGYNPSSGLDKRIGSLIRNNYRKIRVKRFKKGFGKAAACLCVLLAVSSIVLMSVEATRVALFNAVLEWHDRYTQIQFEETDLQSGETSIQGGIYRPTYLPDGFSETTIKPGEIMTMIIYENEAEDKIIFTQEKAGTGTTAVDNEHTDYFEIQISGSKAYLFKAQEEDNASILIWENNGTVFNLLSVIDSDELIRIGESIKK